MNDENIEENERCEDNQEENLQEFIVNHRISGEELLEHIKHTTLPKLQLPEQVINEALKEIDTWKSEMQGNWENSNKRTTFPDYLKNNLYKLYLKQSFNNMFKSLKNIRIDEQKECIINNLLEICPFLECSYFPTEFKSKIEKKVIDKALDDVGKWKSEMQNRWSDNDKKGTFPNYLKNNLYELYKKKSFDDIFELFKNLLLNKYLLEILYPFLECSYFPYLKDKKGRFIDYNNIEENYGAVEKLYQSWDEAKGTGKFIDYLMSNLECRLITIGKKPITTESYMLDNPKIIKLEKGGISYDTLNKLSNNSMLGIYYHYNEFVYYLEKILGEHFFIYRDQILEIAMENNKLDVWKPYNTETYFDENDGKNHEKYQEIIEQDSTGLRVHPVVGKNMNSKFNPKSKIEQNQIQRAIEVLEKKYNHAKSSEREGSIYAEYMHIYGYKFSIREINKITQRDRGTIKNKYETFEKVFSGNLENDLKVIPVLQKKRDMRLNEAVEMAKWVEEDGAIYSNSYYKINDERCKKANLVAHDHGVTTDIVDAKIKVFHANFLTVYIDLLARNLCNEVAEILSSRENRGGRNKPSISNNNCKNEKKRSNFAKSNILRKEHVMKADCLSIDEIDTYICKTELDNAAKRQIHDHLLSCNDCDTQYRVHLIHMEFANQARQLVAEGRSPCLKLPGDAFDYIHNRLDKERRFEFFQHTYGCNKCARYVLALQSARRDIFPERGTVNTWNWARKWRQKLEDIVYDTGNMLNTLLNGLSGVQFASGSSYSYEETKEKYLLHDGHFSVTVEKDDTSSQLRIKTLSPNRTQAKVNIRLVADNIAPGEIQAGNIDEYIENLPPKLVRFRHRIATIPLDNMEGKVVYSISVNV